MKKCILIFVALLLTVSITGCNHGVPADFPDVRPASVLVTLDGKPLADVQVMLLSDQTTGITVTGTTDKDGNAALSSVQGNYTVKGSPDGNFKIVLKKEPVIEGELSKDEIAKMDLQKIREYETKMFEARKNAVSIIPKDLSSYQTTPLTSTIDKNTSTITIELNNYK
ncbi:MAG: hypothetical protein Q4G68_06035 [Planctomycetia bacterium]|nr:hypothetical protein [Planctomycetia bacterium]